MAVIRRLGLKRCPVDRPPVQPRRRACLEAAQRQIACAKLPPERNRCRFTNPPAYTLLFAAEHLAVEERPGRKNNRRGTQDHTVRQREPGHPIALEFQRRRFPLHNLQT